MRGAVRTVDITRWYLIAFSKVFAETRLKHSIERGAAMKRFSTTRPSCNTNSGPAPPPSRGEMQVFSFAAEVDLRHLLLQDIEMQSCASNRRSEPSKPPAAALPSRSPRPPFASSTLTKRICYTPPSQASFGSSDEALQCRLNRAELVFQLDHRDELLRHHFLQNLQSEQSGQRLHVN